MIDEAGAIRGCLKSPLDYFHLPLTENDTNSKLVSNERCILYKKRTSILSTEVYHIDNLTTKMWNWVTCVTTFNDSNKQEYFISKYGEKENINDNVMQNTFMTERILN